jgi:Rrf2 family protein
MRAMLALAADYGKGAASQLKEIAERQNLPANYLEQLMVPLRKANLVSATRGAGGGYTLARAPEAINVAEVVETLEGPLTLVDTGVDKGCCGHPESCALCDLWGEASQALVQTLRAQTLATMLERQRSKEKALIDYSI